MSPFLQLAFLLGVILLAAKLAGYLAIRLGQPSVLGELVVGVLLGPSLVNLMHLSILNDPAAGEIINSLGELGVLLLMFMAGLELHFEELGRNTKVASFAGLAGVLACVALGWGLGLLFGLPNLQAVFLGLTLAATSVSISAQTLMEMNQLRTRVGLSLLGAAVFDDVLVIISLSVFFALQTGSAGSSGLLFSLLRMAGFFLLAVAFGLLVLPRIIRWVRDLPISQNVLTLAIVTLLGYGLAAEVLGGMAAITGAFLAGMMFARRPERESLEPRIHALAYGFFVPIFFVSIGLSVNIGLVTGMLGFAALVLSAAVAGKFLGAGLGARLAGLRWEESLQLGAGMVARGEVGLIVASVGAKMGLVDQAVFPVIVAVIILCDLITPPLLRAVFRETAKAQAAAKHSSSPEAVEMQIETRLYPSLKSDEEGDDRN